jgi:hypothetical protein
MREEEAGSSSNGRVIFSWHIYKVPWGGGIIISIEVGQLGYGMGGPVGLVAH